MVNIIASERGVIDPSYTFWLRMNIAGIQDIILRSRFGMSGELGHTA